MPSPFAGHISQLTPDPVDTPGWTDPVPSGDTTIVYVDSGRPDNSGNGLTEATAKKTIAAGKALLTPGKPDWLLLKAGRTWPSESFGTWQTAGGVPLSGRSPTERMVIGYYGAGAKPIVQTGTGHGIEHALSSALSYLYVLGVDFNAHTWAGGGTVPPCVFTSGGYTQYVHFENCNIQNYWSMFEAFGGGTVTNLTFRRNVCLDFRSLNSNGSVRAIHCVDAAGLLIEENVFDNIASGPALAADSRYGIWGEPACTSVTVRDNIFTRPGKSTIFLQCGGEVGGNVIIQSPRAIILGSQGFNAVAGGVPINCHDNLIIEGLDYNQASGASAGFGIECTNTLSGYVQDNIITQSLATGSFNPRGIWFYANDTDSLGNPTAIRNTTCRRNKIYDWRGRAGVLMQAANLTTPANRLINFVLTRNDIQEPNLTAAGGQKDHLVRCGFGASTVAEFHSSLNRFNRGGSTFTWFEYNSADNSLAQYKTNVSDPNSAASIPAYPNPTTTIGAYNQVIGGASTTAAFIASIRGLSRANWLNSLMAPSVRAYFNAAFNA